MQGENPSLTTPTESSRNSGAGHGEPDAEETEPKPDRDGEMERHEEQGKSSNYQGYLEFTVQQTWGTGPDTVLEDADINNQITQRMKKFMDNSRLFKTPGPQIETTDIWLWKQYCQLYLYSRTEETIRPFRCPLWRRCGCMAQVRLFIEKNYKLLEVNGVHDENSHNKEIKSKKLEYKQTTAIHDAVIIES